MSDNRDKILKFLIENKDRSFDQNELKKQLFPELNKDQVKEFLYKIIKHKPNLMKVYKESSIGILSVEYSGLIDDFLKNGGFEKIEQDIEYELVKKAEREAKSDKLMDLDLKLKQFESKIGKKIVVAGIIITVLNLLVSFLTSEFHVFDDKQSTQMPQVKKQEQTKLQSKLKDSLN
ncbi:hypothetical protein [Maribacter cobaltidurans]|uniref:Uncharacterized protein n=1 Tax=Maribacter cobaltidurans TaxID=1178778 RepID=A0A223V8J5_9FLAO|nr:hypothetical protein [Maribacter cobaltidurans]ASV31626.1 hypothetical protein CJ263_16175 [Maribacter cobaltidurans]GGD97894.1 hypothetical protein GCM10011412_39950 [Maribacter cobaltidurans]